MAVRLQERSGGPVEGGIAIRSGVPLVAAMAATGLAAAGVAGMNDALALNLALGAGAVVALVIILALVEIAVRRGSIARSARLIADDPGLALLTNEAGAILARSAGARALGQGETVQAAMRPRLADPDGTVASMLARVAEVGSDSRAAGRGAAAAEIAVHAPVRGLRLWRIVPQASNTPESAVPTVGLSAGGTILWRNRAAETLIGEEVLRLEGILDAPGETAGAGTVATPKGRVPVDIRTYPATDGGRQVCLLPASATPAGDIADGLFETLPIPILRLGPGGVVETGNRRAADLLNHDLDAGPHLEDLVEGLGRGVAEWIDAALVGRGLGHPETVQVTHAPKETHAQVILSRVATAAGPRVVAVLSDTTELKTLEAQFVQSQKMQAIGQLAGGIAHDFNNLLTAISGHCDLLRLRRSSDDADWPDLEQITQNTQRAAALVGQLLAFSRKQTLELESLDLRGTLSDLTHLLNRLVGERVAISFDHDSDLASIRGDHRQMEQVLLNLVVNARDAMGEAGGAVRISTRNRLLAEPLDRGAVQVPAGRYVLIEVADDGPGIPDDIRAKIFEPFFTTKGQGKGTGLGLSTAYGIVKQSGGFIFADPRPEGGTVFSLWFPALRETASAARPTQTPAAQPAAPAPAHRSEGQGTVLLCEDEAPVRAFAARALALRGFDVIETDCGEAALIALQGMDRAPDILVTDVIMPGLDGPGWVREARQRCPDVPVIFMSGYTEGALDDLASDMPGALFLPKPFSLDALVGAVEGLLVDTPSDPS